MHKRDDLLTDNSLGGLEVFQLTAEEAPSSHVYMEAQIFSPDSRRLLVHRVDGVLPEAPTEGGWRRTLAGHDFGGRDPRH